MLSRRRFLAGGLATLIGAALAACGAAARSVLPSSSPAIPTVGPTAAVTPTPTPSPAGPTLRARIGQMLLVGFRGLTVDEAGPIRRQVSDGSLGGVLLFSVD